MRQLRWYEIGSVVVKIEELEGGTLSLVPSALHRSVPMVSSRHKPM